MKVKLTAADGGVTRVRVDDKVLYLDGDVVELTEKQLKRVKALDGVQLDIEKKTSDKGS